VAEKLKSHREYNGYLLLKKPSEKEKVELLEKVVKKGSLDELRFVLETYQPFELTARALALAARYRGVAFVDELATHGATFYYDKHLELDRKNHMYGYSDIGNYESQYYLMVIPKKLGVNGKRCGLPLYGLQSMGIDEELEERVLSVEKRIECAAYFAKHKELGVPMDDLLFWALIKGEISFADGLIAMGINLQESGPTYLGYPLGRTYASLLTDTRQSAYRGDYIISLSELKAEQLFPVWERLHTLAAADGKKLAVVPWIFDKLTESSEAFAFALKNDDFTRISPTKVMTAAISKNNVECLEYAAEVGWLSKPEKIDELIQFAQENHCIDALTWLMSYQERTVDRQAEEAKREAKLMRELTEDPNSVSALRKIWGYKKLEDGSLMIISYKGNETEVIVPAKIGKSAVTVIGSGAFSAAGWGRNTKYIETRKRIVSVEFPEGVREIQEYVFNECKALQQAVFPSTARKISKNYARECPNLTTCIKRKKTKKKSKKNTDNA
jgi:hypothetical protein